MGIFHHLDQYAQLDAIGVRANGLGDPSYGLNRTGIVDDLAIGTLEAQMSMGIDDSCLLHVLVN